jgi:hypothetical protein
MPDQDVAREESKFYQHLAQKLIEARGKKKQGSVERDLKFRHRLLSDFETSKQYPEVYQLQRLADYYDKNISWFYDQELKNTEALGKLETLFNESSPHRQDLLVALFEVLVRGVEARNMLKIDEVIAKKNFSEGLRILKAIQSNTSAPDLQKNLAEAIRYFSMESPKAGTLVGSLEPPKLPIQVITLEILEGGMHAILGGPVIEDRAGRGGLCVVDFSEEANPQLVGCDEKLKAITDLRLYDHKIYTVGANFLQICELTRNNQGFGVKQVGCLELKHQKLRDSLRTTSLAIMSKNRVFITGIQEDDKGAERGVLIAAKISPRQEVINVAFLDGPAEDIEAFGGNVYVAQGSAGLRIFNDETSPTQSDWPNWITTPGAKNTIEIDNAFVRDIKIAGHLHLAVLACGKSGLRCVDITNPATPRIVPDQANPVNTPGDMVLDVEIVGRQIYASGNRLKFYQIQSESSQFPKLIQKNDIPLQYCARDIEVQGNQLLAAGGDMGLQIFNIEPFKPDKSDAHAAGLSESR